MFGWMFVNNRKIINQKKTRKKGKNCTKYKNKNDDSKRKKTIERQIKQTGM